MIRVRALCMLFAVACCSVPAPGTAAAHSSSGTRLLDYHAEAAWRRIEDVRLSRDGSWLAYAQTAAEADGELIVRDLGGATAYREPRGRAPQFSADGRFVVYRIAPPFDEARAAENAQKPADQRPKNGLGIVAVADGTATTVARVRSFTLSRDGATLAYLLEPSPSPAPSAAASPSPGPSPSAAASAVPAPRPSSAATASPASPTPHPDTAPSAAPSPSAAPNGPGKDATTSLAIRRLGDAATATVEHVAAFAVSADGSRVAYVVQTKAEESMHVRDVATGADRTLAHGTAHLAQPVLSPDGARVAYLSDPDAYARPDAKKDDDARSPFRLMVAAADGSGVVEALGPSTVGAAPRTFASDARAPQFSVDGARLAVWTANVPEPRPSSAPPRVDLDFWYWKDGELPTQQRKEAHNAQHGIALALYDVAARRYTQLGTPAVPNVELARGGRYALGTSNVPYAKLVTYDDTYYDAYRIDVTTGARTLLARKLAGGGPELSPEGTYAAGYDPVRRAWYALRMADGRMLWLTDPRTVRAAVEDDDHPAPPPPYGYAGWTPGDRAIVLYDRYDIWSVTPGSAPVALTGRAGRAMHQTYRVVQPFTDELRTAFSGARPVLVRPPYLLRVLDERTKASGFATLGALAPQTPHVTLIADKLIGNPTRSRDGSRLVFTEQRFDEFPDLWATGAVPSSATRVSDANPQQARYAWGRSLLIDYTNARGERLRAILTTPGNFDPHRHYPMLVYVYERMTPDLHRYVAPGSGTVVNLTRYANHGYVVLQPDITYRIGHTTASAVDCVTSAVKRVVAMGFVDPKRIGMAGHSYGGYEVNALVTHTNIFRAVESGASDSDLPSLYGGFWESGDVQQSYYERSQGRIGAPPWGRPDLYVENSPLFFVGRVHTPYLRIQDDDDGAVPYGQGVEFFTALRRAGKEAYMFTFIGEGHGLTKQPDMDYWTVHLDEFFDHFLLGTPTPEWMTHNGSYEHRGERDVPSLFLPAATF